MTPSNLSRRRERRCVPALLATLCCALAGAAVAADYKFTELGVPGGPGNAGVGINREGHIVGRSQTADYRGHATLWKGRGAIDLGPAGTEATAYGINDHEVIVGEAHLGGEPTRPMRWHRGEVIDLGTLGGTDGTARAVNRCGHVAGYTSVEGRFLMHATLWVDGTPIDLGTLGGTTSRAHAINSLGQVVGESTTPGDEAAHATLWSNGSITDLGSLGGRPRKNSVALGINDAGTVVGYSAVDGGDTHATVWQDGAAVDLGTLGGRNSRATGINNAGLIVGYSDPPNAKPGNRTHAVLWKDGRLFDLNALLENDSRRAGWVLGTAMAINDQGVITGQARNKSIPTVRFAYRLAPQAPPPSGEAGAEPEGSCSAPPWARPRG